MSVTESYQSYRGAIRALAASGRWLAFVTEHPEGRPTALYRLDCESLNLSIDPLPMGARSLCPIGDRIAIGGIDGSLYLGPIEEGKPALALSVEGGPIAGLAPLAGDRLAVASGSTLTIVDIGKRQATAIQSLELPSEATCLAADPTGLWLAAGTKAGIVSVFTSEGRDDFILSESGKLHEGAVTALLFDPDDLRFLSAGSDRKLLSTLARGTLEPEDRGKSALHDEVITSIVCAPGDRFLTGSLDSTVKTWPRSGGARPATLKDGVARVRALAVVSVHGRPRLAVACEDNTIRLFVLDAAGKFGDPTTKLHDALARARHELAEGDPRRREAALNDLAGAGDSASIDLLAEHARADADPALRLDAARLLGQSEHPRAVPLLEALIDHPDESVRRLAFERLRDRAGHDDLRPIDLALKAGHPEIGRLAIEALEPLAWRDEQALDRLLSSLDAARWEVRRPAAESLEAIHDAGSPEANLIALGSKHADVRRWALVRLLRRGLLDRAEVATALRRRAEDRDADVRRVAFLLMLHTRPRLLEILRAKDADLDRQITDLDADPEGEGSAAGSDPERQPRPSKPSKKGAKRKANPEATADVSLDADDLSPLLNAASSRSLDTSLRGARGLALLGDPRAFGLLLQLSRDPEPSARVEVCRALANLGDEAAGNRLRSLLHDPAPEVRDAAFSSLAAIDRNSPLLAAEAGLNADHDDVRNRGLQLLLAEARKRPPKSEDEPIGQLLIRALNDSSAPIRAEAFKATLNLPAAGGGAGALRFARRSVHADVRREVLTEILAQTHEDWGWNLLLEAFDDPDPELRADAFAASSAKSKGLEVPEAALGSRFTDLRLKAVDALVKKHSAKAQAILARAIDDEDRSVRLAAIDSLISADARTLLGSALGAPHLDVRVRAARALARHGDRDALGPLVAIAAAPEPAEAERRGDWLELAGLALDGLAELGDAEAVLPVLPLLDSSHAPLRKGASMALAWCADPDASDPLRQALSHADPQVKYRGAMGLALRGDASTAPLVDSVEGAKILGPDERFAVSVALGDQGEGRLVLGLDLDDETIVGRALLLLLLREFKDPCNDAPRLIAALASRSPRVRLVSADALRSAHDPEALLAAATRLVNDRGEQTAWTVPESTVDALADLLVLAPPIVRARGSIRLLPLLDPKIKESRALELAVDAFRSRFGAAAAVSHARKTPTASPISAEDFRNRAFGTYVGLVREQGDRPRSGKKNGPPDQIATRVRRSSLDRLRSMADDDPSLVSAVVPIFLQTLGDPIQVVRFAAFDHLAAMGTDPALLGAEALGRGRIDIGIRGLELLSGSASDDGAGQSVLEHVMISRKDDLAAEAARLLGDRLGRATVAARAIEAAAEPLRLLAVSWLREAAGTEPKALKALRTAVDSRFSAVRRDAAFALAERKDPAAFEGLVRLLAASSEIPERLRIMSAFETLGDPRAAGVFLDLVEHNPSGTAPAGTLIPAASQYRRPEDADRFLALMDRDPKKRNLCVNALLVLSGHDQPVDDPDDQRPDDRRWMEKQHPRRDAILSRLLDRCLDLGETRLLPQVIAPARWAPGPEVDDPLGRAASSPDDGPRRQAIEAIGWRLRKRSGSADPLIKTLQHPDPTSQFLAAEGLALGTRAEGIGVLLSAIDFLSDLSLRRRAVVALGELGDPRAFDRVMQLAGEHGHALQDVAAEAIGHLGRGVKSHDVYKLLDRQSRADWHLAERALKGLRWLGTGEAWTRIREVADARESTSHTSVALDLLAFDDEPATRDLLLRHIRESFSHDAIIALRGARRLFGDGSIEPDEAAVQNPFEPFRPDDWHAIQARHNLPMASPVDRLREQCAPSRLFELLPRCPNGTASEIATILLDHAPPPIAEALSAIDSENSIVVEVSARILGRARHATAGPKIEEAIDRWMTAWTTLRDHPERAPTFRVYGTANDDQSIPECLSALAWAAGRTGTAAEQLARLIESERVADPSRTDPALLRSAAEALTLFEKLPDPVRDALIGLAREGPAGLRSLAIDALACCDSGRAAQIAPDLIGDPISSNRLARRIGDKLEGLLIESAARPHAQGVAVPLLVARGKIDTLATVAADHALPDAVRLGAVEGLAGLATERAEEHLRAVGLDESNDELLRKSSWQALRRSKRARDRSRNPRRREVTP